VRGLLAVVCALSRSYLRFPNETYPNGYAFNSKNYGVTHSLKSPAEFVRFDHGAGLGDGKLIGFAIADVGAEGEMTGGGQK
jgi:hypothetical protein